MKIQILCLMLTGSLLVGCQPKDNKLAPPPNRSANPNSQGQLTNSFKIGSYGQPLIALQQIELIGSMIRSCSGGKTSSCKIKVSDRSLGPQLIDQRWTVRSLPEETTGELESGQVFGKFKNEILQTDLISAEFSLKKNEDQSFKLEVMQNLRITNNVASEILLLKTSSQVFVQDAAWRLVYFSSQLFSLKQNKTILSEANEVLLNWKSPTCAEIAGLFKVQDGSNKAQVSVNGQGAVLTSASRTPWSQRLVSCTERVHSHQNYDFLFY